MAKPRCTLALVWRDVPPFSCSMGERVTLMKHSVVSPNFKRLERLDRLERLERAQRGHFLRHYGDTESFVKLAEQDLRKLRELCLFRY